MSDTKPLYIRIVETKLQTIRQITDEIVMKTVMKTVIEIVMKILLCDKCKTKNSRENCDENKKFVIT